MTIIRLILIGAVIYAGVLAEASEGQKKDPEVAPAPLAPETPWITADVWRQKELKNTGKLPTRPKKGDLPKSADPNLL